MAELTCWDVVLRIRGPLLTSSSAPLGFGIDTPFARNAAGDYYLAGTLIRGRLKQSWQEFEAIVGSNDWDWPRWIGKDPPESNEQWASERGLLQFTDFIYQDSPAKPLNKPVITYRIKRDRETKAVESGQNQMIQSPFLAGEEYEFAGKIWAIACEDESKKIDTSLIQGLRWTPAVGAETSVGYGVITGATINRCTMWRQGDGWETEANADRWGLALEPEGPLCLSGRRLAENIFVSEPEITGGVIKGAIANLMFGLDEKKGRDISSLDSPLAKEFSKIRVLHAKPVRKGTNKRPGTIPLSAIKIETNKGEQLQDAALIRELAPLNKRPPAFAIDWKSTADAEAHFGIVSPIRELRVRTRIEKDKRRAMDEKLFAYRMLAPRAIGVDGKVEEYEWLTEVDFEGIDEDKRFQVKRELAGLLKKNGLPGVGKLKTRCAASLRRFDTNKMRPATKDTWIVTLRTPAVLCDIEAVLSGLNSAHAAYAKYFARESFNTLELVRHFAEQRLSGGGYLWREFQESKKYRPYVMTQPGSTFVLKLAGDEQAANDKLANWLRSGLPVSAEVPEGQDWRTCPYVPESGFGEIIVNQEWPGEGVGR